MKRLFLFTIVWAVTCTRVSAQTTNANRADEQAVAALAQQLHKAFIKNEVSFLEKNLTDNFRFTDPGGSVHNKKELIDYMKAGNYKFISITPSNRKVMIYENSALATEYTTEKGHVGQDDIGGEYQWMYVFRKQGNDWKIVAGQGTPVIKH